MTPRRVIDVQNFITEHTDRKLSPLQIWTVVLCFLIVGIDGFDTGAIGFIAPALRTEWQVTAGQIAPLFGAGLFGLVAGSFIFGPLADRIGRKYSLLLTVLFFGLASLASAWAADILQLTILRFLTGVGLGGAMPNAITLTSEYCPDSRRSFLTTAMYCGFILGSALGGLAAAQFIDTYGWRSILLFGGIVPLAMLPFLWFWLPESARFLVLKRAPAEEVAAILHKIAPEADLKDAEFSGVKPAEGSPVRQLFAPSELRGTILLWATYFMSLMVYYLLASWLPTVINSAGMSLKEASYFAMMLQVGGSVGAIVIGLMMDRTEPHYVLGAFYIGAAVFIAMIGIATGSAVLLALAVFGAGLCLAGSQIGLHALAAGFYPTANRATGVAWANGIGRMGSVLGSMIGGVLLNSGLSLATVFVVIGAPVFISSICMYIKSKVAPQPVHGKVVLDPAH